MKKSLKALVYGENVTPLPAFKVFSLFLLFVFNSMVISCQFAYLPQLIKSFGVSEVETGEKVGIIVSSYYIARIFASLLWGNMSDRFPKKYVLILSSLGSALASIAFGFTETFTWAVAAKFFTGCCAGIAVVGKAILVDICDDTNMPLGMTVIMSSFSTGLVTGPALGGYLAFPAEQYSNVFSKESLFGRYTILLPNFILAIGLFISTGIFILAFRKNSRIPDGLIEEEPLQQHNSKYGATQVAETIYSPKVTTNRLITRSSQWKRFKNWMLNTTLCRLLRIKSCVMSCALTAIYYMLAVAYEDIYPVLAATTKKYNGYGFNTKDIGLSLLIVSCLMIAIQVPLLGKLTSKYGPRKVFIFSSLALVFCCPINVSITSIQNKNLFWTCVIIISLLTRLALEGGFVTVNVFVNNSVTSDLVGSANGLCMSLTCLTRSVAPTLIGSVFSWSLENIKNVEENKNPLGFPFNQYFTFYILSFFSIFNAFFVTLLSGKIDEKQ
ncbi:uncharacterized protein LOC130642307 [Hydractinia symbiolongicarpus]|uniref:uncharacterized protein LOC130642307 n=1 Tax=Hydractinia symbiolongicarpus TaxID=13093 RepID=UPI00254F127C|nr:uncharacterized protein LOC130642307 [Hydractinia symbiolongicarpus]